MQEQILIEDNRKGLFNRVFSDLIKPLMESELTFHKALDFGCGNGQNTFQMNQWLTCNRIDAFDTARPQFEPESNIHIVEEDSLAHGTYDLVVCNDVLHLLKDKIHYVDFLRSLLTPQGVLALQYGRADHTRIREFTIDFLKQQELYDEVKKNYYFDRFPDPLVDQVRDHLSSQQHLIHRKTTYRSQFTGYGKVYDWIQDRFPFTWVGLVTQQLDRQNKIESYEEFLNLKFQESIHWETERFFFWWGPTQTMSKLKSSSL